MLNPPHPELDDLLHMMGEAGRHFADIEASEGAARDISVCMRWPVESRSRFPVAGDIKLPQPIPELVGETFLVSSSERRLREIIDDPTANMACVIVNEGRQTGKLYASLHRRFEYVTSEFNSHLAVHYDQMLATGTIFHAIIHDQPMHLTFLSHIPHYQNEQYLNTHLMRWQPEMIVNFPDGIGFIPFCVPS